jgi:hypothetical protein
MALLAKQDADGGGAIGDRDPANAAQGGRAEVDHGHVHRETTQEYGRNFMNGTNAHAARRMSVGNEIGN